jgi:hypothetical protein
MRVRPMMLLALLLFAACPAVEAAEKMPPELARTLVRDLEEMLKPPSSLRGGAHRVRLQGIELAEWNERHFDVRLRLRYQHTRGFPKFSTSGTAIARFTVYPGNDGEMCINDVVVQKPDLNRVPEWLDGAWLTKRLKQRFPNEVCAK